MKLSHKLGALCALITALPALLISLFAMIAFSSYADTAARLQVKRDSLSALSSYEKRLDKLRAAAQQLAAEVANKALVNSDTAAQESGSAWARLQDLLPRAQNSSNLDFLIIADPSGRVIARHNDRPAAGELVTGPLGAKNLLAERLLNEGFQQPGAALAAAVVESAETLQRLGLDGVAQVRTGDEIKVSNALMMEAGAPIYSNGRFVGIVLIGQMLNNYYATRAGAASLQVPLVAEVKQVLAGGASAGAVIALGDTVIASSIQPRGGPAGEKPALLAAACAPRQEREELEERGSAYLVAWQPLAAPDGSPAGAIGAALHKGEVGGASAALKATLLAFSLLAALCGGAAGFFVGRHLATRVHSLTEAANRMSLGELSAPVRDDDLAEPSRFGDFFADELHRLAAQLDEMRESFRLAVERLRKR